MWNHVRKPFFITTVCLLSVIEYSSANNTTNKTGEFYANMTIVNDEHVLNTSELSALPPVNYTQIAEKATHYVNNILDFLNLDEVQEEYVLRFSKLVEVLQELQVKDHKRNLMSRKTLERPNNVTKPNFSLHHNMELDDVEKAPDTRRIVSGHNTSITAIPWQVSIRDKEFHICGGTIITRSWIITAAHCVFKAKIENLTVRVGSTWKLKGGEIYDIKRIEVHPEYSIKTKSFDVGLLNLHVFLRFSAKILPIKIIPKMTKIKANTDAVVSGWGKLSEDGKSAIVLQAISLKTIAVKFCIKSALYSDSIVPETMFCAGSFIPHFSDACQGDSGGPIVSDGVLIGIVSWGLGCARGNFPGVYTRLSHPAIRDWVQTHVSNESNPEPHL